MTELEDNKFLIESLSSQVQRYSGQLRSTTHSSSYALLNLASTAARAFVDRRKLNNEKIKFSRLTKFSVFAASPGTSQSAA